MSDLHDRILSAAYPLFVHRGDRGVNLYEVQSAAGVSPTEFDSEFPSPDALAEEVLRIREREWTIGKIADGARERGVTPEGRLLAIFDVFDEWLHRDDDEARTFVNVLLEMGREYPLASASVEHLAHIHQLIADMATEAQLRDPEEFALSSHILMKGALVTSAMGDRDSALRAKEMARDLIARHRVATQKAPSHTEVDWFDSCKPDNGYLPAPVQQKAAPVRREAPVFFAESIQPSDELEAPETVRPAEVAEVAAPPVLWSAVRHDLWVGNHDGEFAGMVELIHGTYWATSRHGRPSGSYPTLRLAEEALEWEQLGAGREDTAIFGV